MFTGAADPAGNHFRRPASLSEDEKYCEPGAVRTVPAHTALHPDRESNAPADTKRLPSHRKVDDESRTSLGRRVSAGLADEWLQAWNALRIEIFLEHHLPSFTRSAAPERFANCVIRGESSLPQPPCIAPAFVDTVRTASSTPRCGGCARRPGSPRRPLIEPLIPDAVIDCAFCTSLFPVILRPTTPTSRHAPMVAGRRIYRRPARNPQS
jgi:hypothetical protein